MACHVLITCVVCSESGYWWVSGEMGGGGGSGHLSKDHNGSGLDRIECERSNRVL